MTATTTRRRPDVTRMTDAELERFASDEDHPLYEAAFRELDTRDECRRDNRVAQALGRALGEQPT